METPTASITAQSGIADGKVGTAKLIGNGTEIEGPGARGFRGVWARLHASATLFGPVPGSSNR
jgi:hypothetical protein